jgi:hypothetical protein
MSKTMATTVLLALFFVLSINSQAAEVCPPGFKTYVIQRSDTFRRIAVKEFGRIDKEDLLLVIDLMEKVNGLDQYHLPKPGAAILVPDHRKMNQALEYCPVEVEQPTLAAMPRAIIIWLDYQLFGTYEYGQLKMWGPISSGRIGGEYETPCGMYHALWKNEEYYSKKYEAEMPYAICFSEDGYFMHQQALPGKPSSHGCIRFKADDAYDIYCWIKINDPVIIP